MVQQYRVIAYLQWPTNRKSMVYWTAPSSMTLNDAKPKFQVNSSMAYVIKMSDGHIETLSLGKIFSVV